MRVLFVSSEVAPFAKSGGLGDVSAALPRQLHALGHDVRVVLPLYPRCRTPAAGEKGREFTLVASNIQLQLGPAPVRFSLYRCDMPNSAVATGADESGRTLPVYFVHCPAFFDRPSLYGQAADEHLRFSVLTWAALKLCQVLQFAPDIAHVNDWQTALLPLVMKTKFGWDKLFSSTKTVLTLHNLGHQGTFGAHVLGETGLGDSAHLFHQEELKNGRIGYLLTGLLYADAITTVSPTYAREIQTPDHGVRLDPVLRARRDAISGILNGIDEEEWNPQKDPYTKAPFSSADLSGKELCKQALLASAKMPYRTDVPVLGLVSRLVWQKGLDLCVEVLPHLLRHHRFQLLVLGKGEPKYEEFFRTLAQAWPHRVFYMSAPASMRWARSSLKADV